jgi:hypothetical protein
MSPSIVINAENTSMGGLYSSLPMGVITLYSNPAGFITSNSQFYMPSIRVTSSVPFWKISDASSDFPLSNSKNFYKFLCDNVSEGFALGANLDIGYIGNALGLGIDISTGLFLAGPSMETASGSWLADFAIVGGFAFVPVDTKDIFLRFGFDLRPTIRFYAPLTGTEVSKCLQTWPELSDTINIGIYQGTALALDGGTLITIDDLVTIGFSFRDMFGTRYAFSYYNFIGDWFKDIQKGSIIEGGEQVEQEFYVPMKLSLGVAFHPREGERVEHVQPLFQIEVTDINAAIFSDKTDILNYLHTGWQITLGNVIHFSSGLSSGNLMVGMGLQLSFLDLHFCLPVYRITNIVKTIDGGYGVDLTLHF